MTRLPLLIGSGVSWMAMGVDEDERVRDGACGAGAAEETTIGAWDNKGMVAEE